MAFGKTKRRRDDLDDHNLETVRDYEDYPNSDDDSVEELDSIDTAHVDDVATTQRRTTKRADSSSKALFDEVILKGVPSGKNPGGAKVWDSRLEDNYKEGPFKKWDVAPEDATIDDSNVRLEEMRWQSLEDDTYNDDMESNHEAALEDIPWRRNNPRSGESSSSQQMQSSQSRRKSQQSQISNFMRGASSSKYN
ncbi:hypothetical protein COLO4_12323 [Corchorus olitorius]|uniref:Uncharacterized protein n=1 Tax=Corchorus olitorius TaxID=93759 RepID=A0A1R3K174_9ROSI|nr:hypothetical protein COLO4_12323 [Corchorus olitorius]